MSYSKSIAIVLTAFVCATAFATDAGAQSRGRSPGGRGPSVGRAVPRSDGPRSQAPRNEAARAQPYRGDGRRYDARVSPRVIGRAPLRSYYYPYYYGYRPGLSIGLGFGYPYSYGAYGYPYYGAYGYPDGAYGSSYGGYYPGAYATDAYSVRPGYADDDYGGIRIQGAPRDAQVFVDGYYAGIVDDYNGTFQHLDLQPGPHEIEVRTAGHPLTYDVNVTPGQTLTIHANVR